MNREPIYGRAAPPVDIYGKTGGRPTMAEDLEDFSDEETPMTEPIYNGSQRSYMDSKGWDVFRVLPPEQDSGSEATNTRCALLFARICKVFAYFLTLIVVLAGCVISKFTFLFATSQIRPRKTVEHCNRELERDKLYQAEISTAEQTAWIWAIFFSYLFYEAGVFLRSGRIAFFKTSRKPSWSDFGTVLCFETLSTVGMVLLLIVVLPELDVVRGCMITNCVAIVPLFLSFMSRHSRESHRWKKTIMDVLAFTGQLSGIIIMAVVESQRGNATFWMIPIAVILVSFSWWENYVDRRSPFKFIKTLGRVKDRMRKTRYFTYTFISIWRMILTFVLILLFLYVNGTNPLNLFSHFFEAMRPHAINVTQIHSAADFVDSKSGGFLQEVVEVRSDNTVPLYFFLAHVIGSYLAYILSKFACKICIQVFSFAFPVLLCGPISVVMLIAACGLRNEDVCWFRGTLPDYLYFECPAGANFFGQFFSNEFGWVWIIMFVGQTWATYHIFLPQIERLAPTEKIFVTPMYVSFLIDQSLSLNRRRDDEGEVRTEELELDRIGMEDNDISQYYETISIHTESSNANSVKTKTSDSITKIYACATMWHETRSEMMEMMKSIFRMDEDQSARRVAQKYLKVVDGDYYEFETHIFFDDAFEISDICDDWNQVNPYVKDFLECVDESASYVHQTNIRIKPPKRIPTPYGGRLVYVLPGKTKMYVHLKDKGMIRHKKRWSQCMYMYYLLGHRLMELPIPVDRKAVIAENTYLLTLDGDIDFQPPAVNLLVDLMKKNKNLGAACGRIHPVGSGPMVWYQLFEYAIGHWLQKATEHMIGCVMCSPGCFSLFRAKALMDDNVMRKYTTKSEEPRHYVQYDQGEDRWLCTLLLQRGYRVEYSAASDAYTHCPEGFSEFFNQRRRWVPSTIANIFDLLMDYKATVKINDNISLPYIWYQCMLMSGTIIGPGTIFLMLVGAFVAAFKISNWYSFTYNLIPIITYTVVCMTCKSNLQLLLSQILSTLYAMVMMAVIVGTALQLGEDGIASPSAVFLISMVGSFFIAACLHPQEFWCIVPGIIYLLCIPSMYLLLIIYSITNLNVVSWGTREGTVKKTKKEMAEERKMAALQSKNEKRGKGGLFSGLMNLSNGTSDPEEGGIDIALGNVLRVMAFTKPQENPDHDLLVKMADILESVDKRMDHLESIVDPNTRQKHRRKSSRMSVHGEVLTHLSENGEELDSEDDEESEIHREPRDNLINPFWIEDKVLNRGEVDYLGGLEIQFWKDLIEKYLHPLDADKAREKKIADGLKELRNKSIFFFSVFNSLFVLIVFMLTLHKDMLHVDWPWGVTENITHIEDTGETLVTKEYLHLEPIGVVLVFFFFAIILIQFTAMLFHRFGTLAHILASTELTCFSKKEDRLSDEALIEKNAVQIVKEMQKLRGIDGEYDSESASSNRLANRQTIHMLERNKHKKKAIGTLDVAFKKRFFALNHAGEQGGEGETKAPQTPILGSKMPMRRETLKALEHRSEEAMIERKQSKMQTLGASNPYNNNKDKHRNTTKLTGATVDRIFAGAANGGFDASNTEDDDVVPGVRSNRSHLQSSIKFKSDRNATAASSSSEQHSSATSKM